MGIRTIDFIDGVEPDESRMDVEVRTPGERATMALACGRVHGTF